MPTFVASGSHHAPRPHRIRPGARSSSVENVLASRAALRVQTSMTPEPTLIRSVPAAKAAIGTTASRTRRLSACQTASKPHASARLVSSMPSRMSWASCRYNATGKELGSAIGPSWHRRSAGFAGNATAGTATAMHRERTPPRRRRRDRLARPRGLLRRGSRRPRRHRQLGRRRRRGRRRVGGDGRRRRRRRGRSRTPPSWPPATSPPSRARSSSTTPATRWTTAACRARRPSRTASTAWPIDCTGTTADGGAAALTGTTTEVPGASVTSLEGDFAGTVDGAEVFTTQTLGG